MKSRRTLTFPIPSSFTDSLGLCGGGVESKNAAYVDKWFADVTARTALNTAALTCEYLSDMTLLQTRTHTHTHIYTHTGLLRNLFIVIVIIIILFMIIIISLSLSHAVADPGVCERAKVDTYTRWCLDTGDRDLKGKEQKGFLGREQVWGVFESSSTGRVYITADILLQFRDFRVSPATVCVCERHTIT